jgi:uncharacterized protein (TIGR02996 family)
MNRGVNRIDELFREVWQRPDDVELRLVLADALLEAGDPRGELIQLQHNPQADHERRAMRLLQRHGLTWLGSLRGAVVPVSYELGFLASCIAIDAGAGGRDEWATVLTVELDVSLIDFLFHPVMRSLRRVAGVEDEHLEPLLRASRCPPELEASFPWTRLPELYARIARVTALHAFHLPALSLSRDADGRLSRLEVSYGPDLQPLLESLPSDGLTSLVVRGVPPASHVRIEHNARAAQHRLASVQLVMARSDRPTTPSR